MRYLHVFGKNGHVWGAPVKDSEIEKIKAAIANGEKSVTVKVGDPEWTENNLVFDEILKIATDVGDHPPTAEELFSGTVCGRRGIRMNRMDDTTRIKQAARRMAWREFEYAEQHPEAISTSERVDTINHHLGRARIELMRLAGTGHEDEIAKMIIELTRMKERVKKLKEGKE